MYHKNVGGEDWRLLSFFVLRGENFFFKGDSQFFFLIFWWKIRVTKYWRSLVVDILYNKYDQKYDIYHRQQCSIFFCWKIMWKYFIRKVYMLVENFDLFLKIIRRNFLLRSSFWLERRWVESNSFRSGTCGIKVFFA